MFKNVPEIATISGLQWKCTIEIVKAAAISPHSDVLFDVQYKETFVLVNANMDLPKALFSGFFPGFCVQRMLIQEPRKRFF